MFEYFYDLLRSVGHTEEQAQEYANRAVELAGKITEDKKELAFKAYIHSLVMASLKQ